MERCWTTMPLAVTLVVLLWPGRLGATPPGVCGARIVRMQDRIDGALARHAAKGPSAPESRSATRSHQPTPASIAAAESRYGAWDGGESALGALARARQASEEGNVALCRLALKRAERELRRMP